MAPLVAGGTLLLVIVFGYYFLFVCLFVYFFFLRWHLRRILKDVKDELTTKKDCELVNKTIVGA